MWEKYKTLISIFSIIFICIFGMFVVKNYINNQVIIKSQKNQEMCEKEKYEIKSTLENDKINQEAIYKKQIIELKAQLEKSKLLLEKIEQEKRYTKLLKNDVKKFMSEIDSLFGIKGKENDKK